MKFKIKEPKINAKIYTMNFKQSPMNTIKFTILMLLGFLAVITSCSDDEQEATQGLSIILQPLDSRFSDQYSFSDMNIRVYANKADWIAEINTIYTGKFDDTGEIFISDIPLEQDRDYYVDVFSDDKVLNNLSVSGRTEREYDYIFRTKPEGDFGTQIFLRSNPDIVGDWKFISTFFSDDFNTRFPVSVNVTKDFNVTITDSTVTGSPLIREFKICRSSAGRFDGRNRGNYTLLLKDEDGLNNECTNTNNTISLDSRGTLTSNLFINLRTTIIKYAK